MLGQDRPRGVVYAGRNAGVPQQAQHVGPPRRGARAVRGKGRLLRLPGQRGQPPVPPVRPVVPWHGHLFPQVGVVVVVVLLCPRERALERVGVEQAGQKVRLVITRARHAVQAVLHYCPLGHGRRVEPAPHLVVHDERRARRELRRELALKVQVVLERARRCLAPPPVRGVYPRRVVPELYLAALRAPPTSLAHRYDAGGGRGGAVRVQVPPEQAPLDPPCRHRALLPAKAPPRPVPGVLRRKRGRAAGRPQALGADPDERRGKERRAVPCEGPPAPPEPGRRRLGVCRLRSAPKPDLFARRVCPRVVLLGPVGALSVDGRVAAPPSTPDDHRG